MRPLLIALLCAFRLCAGAQYDQFSYRYNYAFIEDGPELIPLRGEYRVEYLARGQWWSYMPPRTPVDHPGQQRTLKPCISVNGTPLMVVEMEKDHAHTDLKLRAVRGPDTMIVDLNTYSGLEARMLERTARLHVPPRPPVLLPFREGWFNDGELLDDPNLLANTARFDSLWITQRSAVRALYDTIRYTFTLETDGLRIGPPEIHIQRDPNYAHHLLQFPASGPRTRFELYRQDSLGVTGTTCALRVVMPIDGETDSWVDITDLPYGKYTSYLKWGDVESLFYLVFGW